MGAVAYRGLTSHKPADQGPRSLAEYTVYSWGEWGSKVKPYLVGKPVPLGSAATPRTPRTPRAPRAPRALRSRGRYRDCADIIDRNHANHNMEQSVENSKSGRMTSERERESSDRQITAAAAATPPFTVWFSLLLRSDQLAPLCLVLAFSHILELQPGIFFYFCFFSVFSVLFCLAVALAISSISHLTASPSPHFQVQSVFEGLPSPVTLSPLSFPPPPSWNI